MDLLHSLDLSNELQFILLQLVGSAVEFLLVASQLVVPLLRDYVESLFAKVFMILVKIGLRIFLLSWLLSSVYFISEVLNTISKWLSICWASNGSWGTCS